MFNFDLGEFSLIPAATLAARREAKRVNVEKTLSKRVWITGQGDGGYQGLTADGRRVSDMVDPTGNHWALQWVTAERTETGWIIVGVAAFDSAPPDPVVDGDGG